MKFAKRSRGDVVRMVARKICKQVMDKVFSHVIASFWRQVYEAHRRLDRLLSGDGAQVFLTKDRV